MLRQLLLFSIAVLLSVGCATNSKSRYLLTGLGMGAGAAIGSASAPKEERTELHAAYWAGLVGVGAALAANLYFNDERDVQLLQLENEKLKSQLDFFKNGHPVLLKDTTGKANPEYFSGGKARIKLFKIDQWTDDGPNRKYHRDEMIEISPIEKSNK